MPASISCIVCERTGQWAASLRWHSGESPLPLHETRSLLAARTALLEAPTSMLALETTFANAEGVLRLLLESRAVCPASQAVVLLNSDCRALSPCYWEAGAAFVALSPRRLDRLVRLIRRHLSRQEQPELPFRERIWAQLPW